MREILHELTEYGSLGRAAAKQILFDVAAGKFNASQMGAFMTVYMMRAITLEELQGFRDAMLELCIPVRFNLPLMDVCGTGGDGKNTFNVSTLSAFVVAAAGQPVAKHGNYGVSSVSGSSNVLEYFGFKFTNDIFQLEKCLERVNIFFMHAPLFHPAMKNVAIVRRDLGIKTFFNMLGPMVNPAFPPRQMIGVYDLELARLYGYLYQDTEKEFVIVHDENGYDEISLTGPVKVFSNEGEQTVEPDRLGLLAVKPVDLVGGKTVEGSAKIFITILEGCGSKAQEEVVIANAAMALYTADRDAGLQTAVERAREALGSGKALAAFKKLLEL